ncbi:Histidine--tRNA ligase, mitochondrial [Cytospora mali]|uniref:histidine--tRNA ligase n=1 Tax=Cytospora mali TaxID=578113 RepID=A0A194V5P4_CYTMA|nr:Histidine--tRNA ligase, mitochondrial [Valsa mali var. pyri (nom. inval.)]
MATEDTKSSSRAVPVQLKTPKGTVDFIGTEMKVRKHIFQTLSDVFERHGGQELDTRVFELREILSGKYGEDSKLIYDLEDQGGELCSLRYDLTVPFARWLAMNTNYRQVSRYQIAKVYRWDQPAISRGRYREFYQCDFDIVGEYESMIPDAEILLIIVEGFSALGLDVTIKLNHRRILDGIFAVAGVPEDKIRPVSSAVDKLDKVPWEEVKAEMVGEKGLPEDVADRIGQFICGSGRADMHKTLDFLKADLGLMANDNIKSGINDMEILLSYLESFDIVDKISFDLSLARGLDYYTGLIFAIITTVPNDSKTPASNRKDKSKEAHVGSIAAGGRYENLVGMYGDRNIPCVGVSFGVERIYTILYARRPKSSKGGQSLLAQDVDVYVVAAGGDGLLLERMAVCGLLTKAGIRAAFLRKANPSMRSQFNAADKAPLIVILGPDELAAGNVRLKVSVGKDAGRFEDGVAKGEGREKDRGQLVAKDNLVTEMKRILQNILVKDTDF